MDDWAEKFRVKVEAQGIKIYLLKKYVDDVLVVTSTLSLGSRWDGIKVVISDESREADEKAGRTRADVTMEVL